MKKGIDALTQAVVTGAIVPTNEAQRRELEQEREDRPCDADCLRRTSGLDSAECTCSRSELEQAKHTPGPWHEYNSDGGLIYKRWRVQGAAHPVCDMREQVSPEREAANARLIAAAPDMLAAIEQVLAASEDNGDMNDIDWKGLRAALSKARTGK